ALVHLGAPDALLEKYRVLEKSNCRVTTGIIDDHWRRGTRNTVLPWIWSIVDDQEKGKYLKDFIQLHWLQAKAMHDRWEEELTIIMHEMKWVCKYFAHRSCQWSA
ncbi:hypothetical protein JAAARDRAFT_138650, partial [Jaapia argillacea MUCL 33604]